MLSASCSEMSSSVGLRQPSPGKFSHQEPKDQWMAQIFTEKTRESPFQTQHPPQVYSDPKPGWLHTY